MRRKYWNTCLRIFLFDHFLIAKFSRCSCWISEERTKDNGRFRDRYGMSGITPVILVEIFSRTDQKADDITMYTVTDNALLWYFGN